MPGEPFGGMRGNRSAGVHKETKNPFEQACSLLFVRFGAMDRVARRSIPVGAMLS